MAWKKKLFSPYISLSLLGGITATLLPEQLHAKGGTGIYVTNSGSNTVSIIDITKQQIVDTIQVNGTAWGGGLGLAGTAMYVGCGYTGINVIDITRHKVSGTITLPANSYPYSFVSLGTAMYVAEQGTKQVGIIDTTTLTLTKELSLGTRVPYFLAKAGTAVYVSTDSDTVEIIDSTTQTRAGTISSITYARNMEVSGTSLYVLGAYGSHKISKIDTTLNAVVSTIDAGIGPNALAMQGTGLYTANSWDNPASMSVIQIPSFTDTGITIPNIGSYLSAFQLASSGTGMYVSSYSDNAVSLVNLQTNTVVKTISGFNKPLAIALDAELFINATGPGMYVANYLSDTLNIIDPNTLQVSGSVGTPPGPYKLAPAGTALYVSHPDSNSISIFDTNLGALSTSLSVGTSPRALALAGTGMYVANFGTNTLNIIDTTSPRISGTLTVGNAPAALALAGNKMYVANHDDNSVSIIDTDSLRLIKTLSVGTYPSSLALAGTGMYVTNAASGNVNIIDINTRTVAGTVSVGTTPSSLALGGTGMYVTNQEDNTVNIIDINTHKVSGTVSVGLSPASLALAGTGMFVADSGSSNVQVIDINTRRVSGTVGVGDTPLGLSYYNPTPASVAKPAAIYAGLISGENIYILDTASNTLTGSFAPDPGWDYRVSSFAFCGTALYRGYGSTVNILDINLGTISQSIFLDGIDSNAMVLSGTGMYVADVEGDAVHVIDTTTKLVNQKIAVSAPEALAAVGTAVYAAGASSVEVINTSTNSIVNSIPVTSPNGLAVAGTGVYVTSSQPRINIIDITTNQVSGTITVASSGQSTQAPALAGTGMFFTIGGGSVGVLDISRNALSNQIPLSVAVPNVAVAGTGLYISNYSNSLINIIDTNRKLVAGTVAFPPESSYPSALVAGPLPATAPAAGTGMYVVNKGSNTISVIDLDTHQLKTTISASASPQGIAVAGTGVYFTNTLQNNVNIIDLATGISRGSVNVGSAPYALASAGTALYVANKDSNNVNIIDITRQAVAGTISVGTNPEALALAGTGMYVANWGSNNVSVIDTVLKQVAKTITVGTNPAAVALGGTGIYVANFGSNNVNIIDVGTLAVAGTISVGQGPRGLALGGTGMYVADSLDGDVKIIPLGAQSVSKTLSVGGDPWALAMGGTGMYVANNYSNTVSIIDIASQQVTSTINVGLGPVSLASSLPTSETAAPPPCLVVSATADTNTIGTFRYAINSAIVSGGTITFVPELTGTTISLSNNLPPLVGNIEINPASTGPFVTVDGVNHYQALFAQAGNISINNLTIQHAAAIGGPGGAGPSAACGGNPCGGGGGGGGGAGLGGALFINQGATVTLHNVFFSNNFARGGSGGYGPIVILTSNRGGGGGGGGGGSNFAEIAAGGTGGVGYIMSGGGGGGGGGNLMGAFGLSTDVTTIGGTGGLGGGLVGGGAGGTAGTSSSNGGVGSAGATAFSGGGGGGGFADTYYYGGRGGSGADFGGGGGAGSSYVADSSSGIGGSGGFGGGGGGGVETVQAGTFSSGGRGGFGGGGGGGYPVVSSAYAGGAGADPTLSDNAGGGGGAALGGAIFVRKGGALSLEYTMGGTAPLSNNTVYEGTGGGAGAGAGMAYGPDLFINAGGALTLTLSTPVTLTTSLASDSLSSGVGLIVNGSSPLSLFGSNTYLGGTQITGGGYLIINSDASLGDSSGAVTINNGTLEVASGTLTTSRLFTLTQATLKTNTGLTTTLNGALSGSGPLTLSGDGTIALSADNSGLSANILLGAGTLQINAGNNLGSGQLQLGSSASGGTLEILGDLSAGNTLAVGAFNAVIQNSGYAATFSGGISGSGILYVNGGNNTFSGNITSLGGLTLEGSCSTILSGTNSYTGSTDIGAGSILQINALSALSPSSSLTNDGALNFNNLTGTVSQSISGNGSVALLTGGSLTFSGTNTYMGGTTIPSSGILTIATSNSIPSSGTIDNAGALIFSHSTGSATPYIISGNGYVQLSGAGILTLGQTNTYAGGTRINSGTVEISSASNIGSGALTFGNLASGGTLKLLGTIPTITNALNIDSFGGTIDNNSFGATFSGAVANAGPLVISGGGSTLSGDITGSGSLSLTGSGTTILSGTNSYSGTTTINPGTILQINSTLAALSNSSAVTNDGSIHFNNLTGTLASPLSGSGSVVMLTGGALTLSGTNTYSGGTTIPSAGTLIIAASDSIPSSGTIGNNSLLVFTHSTGSATPGIISGNGVVSLYGAGTLILDQTNTYLGGTLIDSGTVQISSPSNLSSGAITFGAFLSGGTLQITASSSLPHNISVDSLGGTVRADTSTSSTLSGTLSGSGALNLEGPGTITLSGSNSGFSGGLFFNDGTVQISSASNIGSGALTFGNLASGGTLKLLGAIPSISNAISIGSFGGTFENGGYAVTFSQDIGLSGPFTLNGGGNTLSGDITGSGSLTLTGSGTTILSGTNSYSGTTTINGGTILQIDSTLSALSNSSAVTNDGSIHFNNLTGTLASPLSGNGSVVMLTGGALTFSGTNTYSGGTTIPSSGTLTLSAADSLPSSGTISNDGALIFSHSTGSAAPYVISGNGYVQLSGSGTLVLGFINTYLGGTLIDSGTVQISSTSNLGSGDLTFGSLSSGGTLQITSSSSLPHNISVDSFGGTVRADTGTSSTLSGTLSGSGALNLEGPGTITLSGSNSGFSGGFFFNDGTVQISSASNIGSGALTFGNLASGGTLKLLGAIPSISNAISIGSFGGTFENGGYAVTFSQDIGLSGPFTLNGGGNTLSGDITGSGSLALTGSGTTILSGTNSYSGTTTINSGTILQIDSTLSALSNSSAVTNDGSIHFNNLSGTLASPLSGSGSVVMLTGGALTFSGTNTYSGGTTIPSSGTLTIAASDSIPTSGTISNGGALIFSHSTGSATPYVISGNGYVQLSGAGTLTLGQTNTYLGGTRINAGTVQISSPSNLSSGDLTFGSLSSGGTLQITASSSLPHNILVNSFGGTISTNTSTSSTLAGTLSGSGNLTFRGSGTLTLSGSNGGFSGGLSFNDGTVQISSASNIGSGALTFGNLASGGTLKLLGAIPSISNAISIGSFGGTFENGGYAVTFSQDIGVSGPFTLNGGGNTLSGDITGSGSLALTGSGTTILSGTNSYSGTTTINSGTILQIDSTLSALSNSSAVTNDGSIHFNNLSGTLASPLSGSGSVVMLTGGALTFSGTNTYSGGTTIPSSGTLTLSASDSIPTSGTVSNDGALIFSHTSGTSSPGSIQGSGQVQLSGSGVLALTHSNTYAGGTLIDSGTVQISLADSLGTGGVTIGSLAAGGSLEVLADLSLTNSLTIGSEGATILNGSAFNAEFSGNIANGGALTINGGGSTFSGNISGAGSLTLSGSGTTILSGINSYFGNTLIPSGTILRIDDVLDALSSNSAITDNGSIQFNNISDSLMSTITGSGSVEILGGGTIIVEAAQTYTGGTTIPLGAQLSIDLASGIPTSGTISNEGALVFTHTTGTAQPGPISGGGSVEVSGGGTLSLTQTNTYSGDTIIGHGTLQVSSSANLGSGSVTLGHASDSAILSLQSSSSLSQPLQLEGTGAELSLGGDWTLSGDMQSTSNAPLLISGSGTMHFSGTNHSSGLSTVASSSSVALENGTFSGPVTLSSNASLQGTGQVGTLINNGTTTPVSQLDVVGNYTQTASGALHISIQNTGACDLLNVSNTATVDGTLMITASGSGFTPGQTFTILQAGDKDGLIGSFSSIQLPSFLKASVTYYRDPMIVLTILNPSPIGTVPVSGGNAEAVAKNLQEISYPPDSDLANVIAAMDGFDSEQLTNALEQLHPAQFGAFDLVLANTNSMLTSIYARHASEECCLHLKKQLVCLQSSFRNNPFQYLYEKVAAFFRRQPNQSNCIYAPTECKTPPSHVWLEPFGSIYTQKRIKEQLGFHANTVGGVGGIDHRFSNNLRIGLGGSYNINAVDWHQHRGKGHIHSASLALYMDYLKARGYLEASVMGALDWFTATRHISFSTIDRHAHHHSSGYDLTAHVGGGGNIRLRHTYLTPFFSVDYFHQQQDSFTEKGAISLNLHVRERQDNILRSELGLSLSHSYKMGQRGCFAPTLWVSGINETFLTKKDYTANFEGEEPPYHVSTFRKPIYLVSPGLDLDFKINNHFGLSTRYSAELNSNIVRHRMDGRVAFFF